MSQQRQRPAPPPTLQGDDITTRIIRENLWRPANLEDDWRVFAIVGRESSGKSLTCASILHACDPNFWVDNTHFEPVPFLEDIGYETEEPGMAVMSDESGVAFGNRTWHDREQIEANQYLQTARDHNRIIGLTAPRLEELDKQLKGRLHVLIECVGKQDGEFVEVKWKNVDPSRGGEDQIYKKYPRVRVGTRVRRVTRLKIGPPPAGFIDPYQQKKAEWKQDLKERVVDNFTEEADEEDQQSASEIADEILSDNRIEEFKNIHGGNGTEYIDWKLIKAEYQLSQRDAKAVKSLLEKETEEAIA